MKNSERPTACREGVERVDEDLADQRRDRGRRTERDERALQAPRMLARLLLVRGAVLPQVPERHCDVDAEQHDRNGKRQDRERVPFRVAVKAGHGRHEEEQHREDDERELQDERAPVETRVIRPDEHREPEHEQDVRHDASRERAANDVRQSAADREERDDQLRRVAEARVQEAADAGPRVLGRVLGRFADQPRERDQRRRREHEQDRLVGVAARTCATNVTGASTSDPQRSFRATRARPNRRGVSTGA